VHSFHVVLANGTERDIKADDARIDTSGALVLYIQRPEPAPGQVLLLSVAYPAGTWLGCELERKDDRG